MNDRHRTLLTTGLKYAVAAAVIGWLLSQVDWERVGRLVAGLDTPTVLAVFGVTVIGLVGRFYTWQVLVGRGRLSLADAGRLDLAVNFINQLFPSRLSGRSAAPLFIRQYTGVEMSDAVSLTGFHTAVYAGLYGLVSLVGIWLTWTRLSGGLLVLIGLSASIYVVSALLIVAAGLHIDRLDWITARLRRAVGRVPVVGDKLAGLVDKVPEFTAETAAGFAALLRNPRIISGYTAGWVVAMLVAPGLRFWLLLQGFGTPFSPAVFLPVYLVTAYSVTLLPLTPGGIGISEASATLVFVALGIPESVVIPIVLLDRVLGVYLPALVGSVPAMFVDISDSTS